MLDLVGYSGLLGDFTLDAIFRNGFNYEENSCGFKVKRKENY